MKVRLATGLIGALLVSGFALAGSPQSIVIDSGSGYLGVVIRDIKSSDVSSLNLDEERGVYVERVEEGSPAESAGLRKGDVVIEIGGLPVISVRQFRRLVGDIPPGRVVVLEVVRDGSHQQLSAEIGSRGKAQAWSIEVPDRKEFHAIPRFRFEGKPIPFGEGDYTSRFFRGPRLGIEGTTLTDQMAERLGVSDGTGVLVMRVMKDTPAEKAGLQAGDVITAVDGEAVRSPSELRDQLDEGQHEITLVRDKRKQTLTVTLGESPRGSSETLEM